jgi:hypothetical protein
VRAPDTTTMGGYDGAGGARRYIALYRTALRRET